VQPKNITFPTDAKLLNRAREKLVKLAKSWRGATAVLHAGRQVRSDPASAYAHAKQFKRANRSLRKLKNLFSPRHPDIARKIDGAPGLEAAFAPS